MGMLFSSVPNPATARARIADGLARLVAPDSLIVSRERLKAYETDGYPEQSALPLAVVLPRSTTEVQAVMRFCASEGVAVVPRGSGTSLTGGVIPLEESVLIGTAD
jgi:glycolate oxidase